MHKFNKNDINCNDVPINCRSLFMYCSICLNLTKLNLKRGWLHNHLKSSLFLYHFQITTNTDVVQSGTWYLLGLHVYSETDISYLHEGILQKYWACYCPLLFLA